MPTLSERDLGHIVKLFNAIRSVLDYDKAHRQHHDTASASASASTSTEAPSVTPSVVLREHHDQHGTTATLLTSSATAQSAGGVSTVSERRLWTELGFLMWRVVAVQKLSLMSYVTSDPGLMLCELARALLAFLKESCASVAGTGKTACMRHVAFLAEDRLLFLLRILCSLKNCTVMLSETSGRDNASAAQEVFDVICRYVVVGQHFSWMSQIYVWFCDEAARLSRCGGAVPSAYVYAAHDALRCILGCCTNHEGCARAMLYSEPVACVSYMFYGLKLRISLGDPLRPYEDDHPLVDTTKLGGGSSDAAGSRSTGHDDKVGGSPLDKPRTEPIPQRPTGARYLKTRYFTTLTTPANATTQGSSRSPGTHESTNAAGNTNSIVASLAPPVTPSSPGQSVTATRNTSWAFNLPGLSRQQLKVLLMGGRENAFDALMYSALDVVVEAVRVTRDYSHWMVLSVTTNLLLLSKRSIEVKLSSHPSSPTAPSPPPSFSAAAAGTGLAPPPPPLMPLSHVVAMYDNITVMFQLLYSLMQGLDSEKSLARCRHGTATAAGATGTTTLMTAAERSSKHGGGGGGGGGGNRAQSTLAGPAPPSETTFPRPPLRGAAPGNSKAPLRIPAGLAAAGAPTEEAVTTTTAAGPARCADTAQLREDFAQHLVHTLLQTDVHAVVAATTRVLQCDRTLFRVLHAFCVLDAVPPPTQAVLAAKGHGDAGRAAKRTGGSSTTLAETAAPYPRGGGGGNSQGNPLEAVLMVGSGGGGGVAGVGGGDCPGTSASGGGGAATVPVFNAAASFFMTSNFGDLRHLVSEAGENGGLGGGGNSSHNSSHTGGGGGLGGSGFMGGGGGGGTHPMTSTSFSLSNNLNSASLTLSRPGQPRSVGRQMSGTQQRLRQRRRDDSSPGGGGGGGSIVKAGTGKGGAGGENFAKSFFKSFFGARKPGGSGAADGGGGGAGGTLVRGLMHGDSDGDDAAERDSWDRASRSSSDASDSDSVRSGGGDGGSSDSDNVSDGDDLMNSTMGTLTGSMAASPSPLRVMAGLGGLVAPNFTSRRPQADGRGDGSGAGGGWRHRRRKTHAKKTASPWRDVPSYTALVSELVRIFNLVLGDGRLSVDVRLGTGLLLPSIVLRDNRVFRLYEGRMLIRNYLSLLLHELQHNIRLRGVPSALPVGRSGTTGGAATQVPSPPAPAVPGGEREGQDGPQDSLQRSTAESPADASASTPKTGLSHVNSNSSSSGHVMSGRTHLTQRELIAFAPKVIEALEQTFKVLGVTPLTSDVASLTELPLYFLCADGVAPLGVAIERSFTRVVVLWLIGLVGAQCDEDIDRHAMEVLLHLMTRAISRGSLPKDSSTTLMVTPSGAATVVQVSSTSGVAVPAGAALATTSSSADWASARRAAALLGAAASGDVGAGRRSPPSGVLPVGVGAASSGVLLGFAPSATLSSTDGASSVGRGAAAGAGEGSGGQLTDGAQDADLDLCRSHFNNSLFDAAEYVGLATAAGLDSGMAECSNTVEALSSVFRVLLGRTENLLTPAGLATVLSLFTSHDSNLSRLGRECMMRSLETPSVYPLYADVILDSDTYLLTQTLSVLAAYLTSSTLTPVTRRERRLWMKRCGCVDAAIRVLVRVLDSPQSTPTFMKVVPHLFLFLSAFESGDHKPPQLSSTNFIASVTERLALLEGTEYFIIIAQATLDASMGTYGGVDGGYSSAGGPGAHYAEMQVIGNFHVALYNCAAEKPIFLELLPSLLAFAERHSEALFHNLVEVLYHVLECTGNIRSDRLADFILAHKLSQLLPFLELSGKYVEERLPFTGAAVDLHSFWQPILLRAPRRSKLRFTSHGGVQVSVGLWPETGFTISAWFKFDRLYTTIPLFEFDGVLGDGMGPTAPLRGTSMSASLFVFGGDSVQLSINDGRRITVNENQALQNFTAQTWLHVCAVLRTTNVLDVYVSGFKVGTAALPYFASGTEVHVNVGCSEDAPHHAVALSTDAAPLFSMSDITLWSQALTRSQLEAELGEDNCGAVLAVGSGRHGALPVKILPESIPQELSLFRQMNTAGAGGGGGGGGGVAMLHAPSPGNTPNLSVGGFATRVGPKGLSAGLSLASGHSFIGANTSSVVVEDDDGVGPSGGGGSGCSWSASAARMARFVPYENEDNLLRNVVAYPTGFPVIAKLVGRYATPPKTWVDYPLLWATRGGLVRLLDWLHLVTSSAQLESLLQLILECVKRTTLAVTLDPRMYMLFSYMLTHHAAPYVTNTACDQLLTLASTHLNVFDEEHRIIINRLAFEHILADLSFYAAVRLDTALYLLQRVRRLFHTSQCRYARHNARFVSPYRFVDRLLHSLIGVAGQTPLPLRRAAVQVAQQVVVACDMEDGLVQIFVALVALLTPEEMTSQSRGHAHVKVLLPAMVAITRGTVVPLRTANNLTTLLLASLVECLSQSACVTALSHTVDLPWYAATISRFADPASVVYATRIFFEAVRHNPVLHEEVAQHQAAVVEALTEHAVHEDLILLLLALTMGATRHVDVLSRKHSLLQQLDSLLTTCSADPNTLVAPIFVQLLVVHLHRVVQSPWRRLVKAQPVLHDEQRLSFRVRRYFSLARVCSRIMILIKVRRYRGLLVNGPHHDGPLHAGAMPADTVMAHSDSAGGLPNAHYHPRHARMRSTSSGGGGGRMSRNASFALGGMGSAVAPAAAAAAAARGSDAQLDNPSFASAGRMWFGTGPPGSDTGAAVMHPHGGEGDEDDDSVYATSVAMTSAQSHPQSLRAGREPGRGSPGGYVYGDEEDVQLERTPFEGIAGLRRPTGLLATPRDLGDDDTGGASSCGGGNGGHSDAPEWKPPVLLPDMWDTVPPPLPTTAMSSIPPTPSMDAASTAAAAAAAGAAAPTASRESPTSSALLAPSGHRGSGVVVSASGHTSEAPTTNTRSPVSSNVMQYPTHVHHGDARDFMPGTGLDSGDVSAQIREEPNARVRSRTHRRAFAVLRVCVLLWLPVQARRCRWVFTPHVQPYEDDFKKRHAGTLFCVHMLRHFAAMPSYFYLFVNSPLQTAALSSLVAYISRDMLIEQLDTWDQMIRSLTVAPARDAGDGVPVVAAMPPFTTTAPSAAAAPAAPAADTTNTALAPPASAAAEAATAASPRSSATSLSSKSDAEDEKEATERSRSRATEGVEGREAGEGDTHAGPPDAVSATHLDSSLLVKRGVAVERTQKRDEEEHMECASFESTVATHTESMDTRSGESEAEELDHSRSHRRDTHVRDARWVRSRSRPKKTASAAAGTASGPSEEAPCAVSERGLHFGSDTTVAAAAAAVDEGAKGADDGEGDDLDDDDALPPPHVQATALRRVVQPSSMTFRSAGSSSAQMDQLTVLETPPASFAMDKEDANAMLSQGGSSVGGGRLLSQLSFDSTTAPPSMWATRLPADRAGAQRPRSPPERRVAAPPTHPRIDLHGRRSLTPARDEEDDDAPETTTTAEATAGPDTRTALTGEEEEHGSSPAKKPRVGTAPARHVHHHEHIDGDDDDDDDSSVSSGVSSVSTQASAASTSSATASQSASSLLPLAAAARSASSASKPSALSFNNLPSAAAAGSTFLLRGGNSGFGLGRDPSDLYAMSISKMAESVAEVVRRDTVGILRSLIRASLDTLPVPHWIAGPTYGSCGGLLFQLLFIVSAKPAADDSTTTLVRYFLLCVGNAVKELRDRDLVEPESYSPEHGTVGPRKSRAASQVAPLMDLGGAGLHAGESPSGSPMAPQRTVGGGGGGGSSFYDASTAGSNQATASTVTVSVAAGAAGVGATLSNGSFATPTSLTTAWSSAAMRTPLATLSLPQLGAVTSGSYASVPATAATHAAPLSPTALTAGAAASPMRHHLPVPQRVRGRGAAGHAPAARAHGHGSGAGGSGVYSDVFLFNVSHFTDLIVDMLAINVLDLPMATHYFLTLLVLCQGWPTRYVDQLSWQVMRACIAVLNRPSMQDASVGLIESIFTLSTLVLRRGWMHKGVLESLLRVLYRVYGSLPPAWMPDADARHRKHLITLIFRHLVQTYAGTKELEKALTVRTLTQRLSVYDDFLMIFSLPDEAECCATFDEYCVGQFSSLETLMAGRLKTKADLAFKASIKTRSEYIKRIKAFNAQLVQATEVTERYTRNALRSAYAARFSSYVAATPRVHVSQLHWLLSSTCALRETHTAAAADSCAVGGERDLYHYMDPQMNYGTLKGVRWGEERAPPAVDGEGVETTAASGRGATAGGVDGAGANGSSSSGGSSNNNSVPASNSRKGRGAEAGGRGRGNTSGESVGADEHVSKNDLVRAAQCEGTVQHIAVLVPPFSTRCRPHIGDDAFPTALKDLSITLTPSAMTLLRYLVSPHETLRFLSNGFRVNGIHATPCLILLTNVTLKVIGFSRVTESGNIILCEHDDEDDDDDDAHSRGGAASESSAHLNNNNNNSSGGGPGTAAPHDAGSFAADGKGSPSRKPARKNPFSMASMTKQFQKLFYDDPAKRRQQQDGTRVAQAVRQVMGNNYQNIYLSYLVSSIRVVRSLRYMHLDTAVQLQLYYDNGPMLSVVDAKQSMNPSARKEFLKVLKDVVGPQQCVFVDEGQRAANTKAHLVRWATGSLSNYEYLRFLNEVAGRTNRDLNQYPVFPWVLADYTSATLDLESAATFRNFSYPMGAQTEARRALVAQFFENTREVCDIDTGKSYPFHHGTHYSTSGGVLYFLLRVQPFTTYARLFQGGDFDLAMRLFDSVAASFMSCITGPADCKELIPEFYMNSGFLANADRLSLGVKSDGDPVDDVRLPPWAKNSRQVFTAVMRYALECPYVVEHLHQWIDLVFGVRRRGPLAMERCNVFQRMTYGEEVAQALKEAETPHDCDVIIAEVDNFGQTPPQLFQERHPSHHELAPVIKAGSGNDGGGGGSGSAGGSGGGGGVSRGDGHLAASAPAAPGSSMSAVTLGGMYNSASAAVSSAAGATGAGSQVGMTFSKLVSSGAFASGQTYTLAFRREAPKVLRMLIHAMDDVLTWYVLRDPPTAAVQHPPPPALTEVFRFNSQAVLSFSMLRTPRKLAGSYAQLVPVEDTDHYLCWHEREAELMRYTASGTQSAFHSAIAFEPPDESDSRISAVAVGPRESILLIAISSGAVYCLFPDDAGNGSLHVRVTLCYHRSAVTKIALDSARHRAVTITRSACGDDDPVLWRVQRSGCSFVARLPLSRHGATTPAAAASSSPTSSTTLNATAGSPPANASGSPMSASLLELSEARTAVDVAIDSVTGNIALVTARSLILFDHNGEPFGAGTLPCPSSLRPVGSVMLEEENGEVGVVVGRPVPCVADMTAVVFYQAREWASGMGVLLTGHKDGGIAVWRTTRLPPDTVAPGRIAMVEFHARLFGGAAATSAAAGVGSAAATTTTTAMAGGGGLAAGGAASPSTGLGAPAECGTRGGWAMQRGTPFAAGGGALGGAGGAAGTGATNCAVTALQQERADVPTFFVGYANGTVRQLVFEDPSLAAAGGSGGSGAAGGGGVGAGKEGGGSAGDDQGSRR